MREINQSSPEATSHENRPASGNVCSQNRMYPKLIYFIQTYFLSKCKTEIKSLSIFLALLSHCSSGCWRKVTAVRVILSFFFSATSKKVLTTIFLGTPFGTFPTRKRRHFSGCLKLTSLLVS